MPRREVGLAGLYKSVSTVENSGFTRSPQETPARWARRPKRSYCPNELKVMWLLQFNISPISPSVYTGA